MSICRYGGIYDFIELGGRESAVGREERGRKKKKRSVDGKKKIGNLFLFQMCFRPHMVLVLAYIPRISEVTRDPAPQTNMILAVSL